MHCPKTIHPYGEELCWGGTLPGDSEEAVPAPNLAILHMKQI